MYWMINQAHMLKGACLHAILFGSMLCGIGCTILYRLNQVIHNLGRPIQNSLFPSVLEKCSNSRVFPDRKFSFCIFSFPRAMGSLI